MPQNKKFANETLRKKVWAQNNKIKVKISNDKYIYRKKTKIM